MNKSKKSYFFKAPQYDKFQIDSGSVSKHDIKSVWFDVKGFMESNEEGHKVDLRRFLQRMRYSVTNALKAEGMSPKFIMDPQIKESYDWNYYCFYEIEFNFFPLEQYNHREMGRKIANISKYINAVYEQEKHLKLSKYKRKLDTCQNQENAEEKKPITAE